MILSAVRRILCSSTHCSCHRENAGAMTTFSHRLMILSAVRRILCSSIHCCLHVSMLIANVVFNHRRTIRRFSFSILTIWRCWACHVFQAPAMTLFLHCRHILLPMYLMRRPSLTLLPHVFHTLHTDFLVHRRATFFTNRLRRSSARHLSHASACDLFVQRPTTFAFRYRMRRPCCTHVIHVIKAVHETFLVHLITTLAARWVCRTSSDHLFQACVQAWCVHLFMTLTLCARILRASLHASCHLLKETAYRIPCQRFISLASRPSFIASSLASTRTSWLLSSLNSESFLAITFCTFART